MVRSQSADVHVPLPSASGTANVAPCYLRSCLYVLIMILTTVYAVGGRDPNGIASGL